MSKAEVGNDLTGDDPTANRLIKMTCDLLGKEDAMFLPTGVMCNGVALRTHSGRPGDSIILDKTAHISVMEGGIAAGLAGLTPKYIDGNSGIFTAQQVEETISTFIYDITRPKVISIEQTTNFGGGRIWPLEYIQAINELAKKQKIAMHMDGARLLHACEETGISPKEYCSYFDSVGICYSKCLGAPIGSVLAGSKEFIANAWYHKIQLGGAMHQVGNLAAACIYGFKHNLKRLKEIHKKAKLAGNLIQETEIFSVHTEKIEINIVFFKIRRNYFNYINAYSIVNILADQGIRILAINQDTLRIITHLDTTEDNIKELAYILKEVSKKVYSLEKTKLNEDKRLADGVTFNKISP